MICDACGIEAPTKRVEFHQNIGALIVRFPQTVEGDFCKSCVHQKFWKMTGITLFLGWWGVISFFVTPVFIVLNSVRYVFCLGMSPVPALAVRPELTEQIIASIRPHTEQVIARLNAREDLKKIAADIAYTCGATPGQSCCISTLYCTRRKRTPKHRRSSIPASQSRYGVERVVPGPHPRPSGIDDWGLLIVH